jgi:hypothetical protein
MIQIQQRKQDTSETATPEQAAKEWSEAYYNPGVMREVAYGSFLRGIEWARRHPEVAAWDDEIKLKPCS